MTPPNHSPQTPAPTEEAPVLGLGTGESMVDRVNELTRSNRSIALGLHLIDSSTAVGDLSVMLPGQSPAPGFVQRGRWGDNR